MKDVCDHEYIDCTEFLLICCAPEIESETHFQWIWNGTYKSTWLRPYSGAQDPAQDWYTAIAAKTAEKNRGDLWFLSESRKTALEW